MAKPVENYDVIVVGGGSSGLMAAGRAASLGKKVLLLEKNNALGEKLKITGGGRCNITNAEDDIHKFLKHYGKGASFLYSPFSQFGMKDTFTFFESRGLPLVVEARKRAFPETQRAYDVFKILEKYVRENKVTVKTNAPVIKVSTEEGRIRAVLVKGAEYRAKNFIFATGGVSHPETGSTGDGFKWLKELGHTVVSPTPDIVPLEVKDAWIKSLAGVSLSFMKITFFCEEGNNIVKQFTKKGKILFTHFGLSGPLILNSSKMVSDLLHKGNVTAFIDAYPDTDIGTLEAKIIKVFDQNKNKDLKNIFKEITPDGTSDAIMSLLKNIDTNKKVHSITKEERRQIVDLMKALPVSVKGLMGHDRAVVSDGGIDLREIDTKTMRSKKIDNLFVTGDLLHINRPSGGYSLQLCWTTGYIAGGNA